MARVAIMEGNPMEQGNREPTMSEVITFCEMVGIEATVENMRNVNAAMKRNPAFYMEKHLFELVREFMPPDQFKAFLEKKLKLEQTTPVREP